MPTLPLVPRLVVVAVAAALALITCGTPLAAQALRVHPAYGSHAVWQRGAELTLTGHAPAGSAVTLRGGPYGTLTAKADKRTGAFALSLPAKPAGGPYALEIAAEGQPDAASALTIRDVYLGDVIVLSGQSNMEWRLGDSDDAAAALAGTDSLVRHFDIPHIARAAPSTRLPAIAWRHATPEHVANFSGVGYFLAEELRRRRPGVAIGLVNASWGGSRIEAWLPAPRTSAAPPPQAEAFAAELVERWAQLCRAYPEAFEALSPSEDRRLGPLGDEPAERIAVGMLWEDAGLPQLDGRVWFDREFELDAAPPRGLPAILSLGAIDDSDSTFVNGRLAGAMSQAYAAPRYYVVPGGALRAGANRISVWVEDTGGGGGLYSHPDSLYLQIGEQRIPLGDRPWRARLERVRVDSFGNRHHEPHLLYNGMLHSLRGLAAAAVVWYQGESNAADADEARRYARQLQQLVRVFRHEIVADPELPFVAVELPEWMPAVASAYEPGATWPQVRSSQAAVRALPRASSAVTLGLGDADDIHPRAKRPVALRVADEIGRLVYGVDTLPRAARPRALERTGQGLIVAFDEAGAGMGSADGRPLRGFAARDADTGEWFDVAAAPVGAERVRIEAPVARRVDGVAYAWANNPAAANLVNGWGLPVSSFRVFAEE